MQQCSTTTNIRERGLGEGSESCQNYKKGS